MTDTGDMDPSPSIPEPRARSVRLTGSDRMARLRPDDADGGGGGWVLEIDGREQSHVDLADPTTVRYEYLRRMATVLDTLAPPGEPLRVVHLGAGALTLARYVQATRPGSPQVAAEIERELVDLVLRHLPLPPGTDLRMIVGDAREELARLDGERFDAIVLDVFSGAASPPHLARTDFYAEALGHLTARGALLVNVGDDPPLAFWAVQALSLLDAADDAGCPGAWTLCDASLLGLDREGNLVLVAGPGVSSGRPAVERETLAERWRRAGPHPAAVLDAEETEDLAETVRG